MCRNIRTLFNFDPPATDEEIRASALQFVRKLSGFNEPSKANEPAFSRAIEEVADAARRLLDALDTGRPPRNREEEAMKARARARAVRIAGRCLAGPGRSPRGRRPLPCATGLRAAGVAAHGSAIAIDEGHELLGRLGEELKFAGVERFAQPLQQKCIGAIGEGWAQA